MERNSDFSTPDTIMATGQAEREVAATSALLPVSIQGASVVTGSMALKRAREVAALVTDLASVGIAESDIQLLRVRAQVSTGALGMKTSSATYDLVVRCNQLERFADVVGVITAQKNTTLHTPTWRYGDEEEMRLELLEAATRQARRVAERVARTLGVRLLGVRATRTPPEHKEPIYGERAELYSVSRSRMTTEDLGLEVTHTKLVTVRTEIEFRVSGFVSDAVTAEPQNRVGS